MDQNTFSLGTSLCSGIYSVLYEDAAMEREFKLLMVEDRPMWWDFLSISLIAVSHRFGIDMGSWNAQNEQKIVAVLAEGVTDSGRADVEAAVSAVCRAELDFSRSPNEIIRTYMAIVKTLAILIMYQVDDLQNVPEFILDNVALATDAYTEALRLTSEPG